VTVSIHSSQWSCAPVLVREPLLMRSSFAWSRIEHTNPLSGDHRCMSAVQKYRGAICEQQYRRQALREGIHGRVSSAVQQYSTALVPSHPLSLLLFCFIALYLILDDCPSHTIARSDVQRTGGRQDRATGMKRASVMADWCPAQASLLHSLTWSAFAIWISCSARCSRVSRNSGG